MFRCNPIPIDSISSFNVVDNFVDLKESKQPSLHTHLLNFQTI